MEITPTTIRRLIQEDRRSEALELAAARSDKDVRDSALHLAWADLLADLDLYDEMLTELNLAARDAPRDEALIMRLAEACLDNGKTRQAVDCYRDLIKMAPDRPEHYQALGRLLTEAGKLEAATQVYRAGLAKTDSPVFKGLLRDIVPPADPEQEEPDRLAPEETDLVRFCHLFEGREGVYARQWVGPTGKSGYTPVREPFTPLVARNHILGNYTVGIYPMRMDNTVRFLAFDLDVPSYEAARGIGDRQAWEKLVDRTHQAALRVMAQGRSLGLPFYLEDSGFKGRHCWLFFQEPVPGAAARRLAQALLEQVNLTEVGVQVEVFPKQAVVRDPGLGNLIKLPLGIHRASGKRSLFVDEDGRPLANQLACLNRLETVPRAGFLEMVKELRLRGPGQTRLPLAPNPDDAQPSSSAPAGPGAVEEYDPERDPELQYLLLKCEVLRSMVEDLNRDGRIGSEEILALTHTVGHLKNGPAAFNALLKRSIGTEASEFLKGRLKGNPISCPKIRQRLPHLTSRVVCDCRFDQAVNLYPSPVRHVQFMSVENAAAGVTLGSMRFEQLLREYMKVKRQLAELGALLKDYEKYLAAVFEESGAEEVTTSQGVLRLTHGQDGRASFALTI